MWLPGNLSTGYALFHSFDPTLENWTSCWKKRTNHPVLEEGEKRHHPFIYLYLLPSILLNQSWEEKKKNIPLAILSLFNLHQKPFSFPLTTIESFLLYAQQVELFHWRMCCKPCQQAHRPSLGRSLCVCAELKKLRLLLSGEHTEAPSLRTVTVYYK